MVLFTEMIRVAALLIAFAYVYGRLFTYFHFESPLRKQIVNGIIFSAMCLINMLMPIELGKGIFIDSRVIIIAYSGLFGGFGSSLMTGAVCAAYRFHMGGAGLYAGFISIFLAVILGYILSRFYSADRPALKRALFAGTGLANALGGLAALFILMKLQGLQNPFTLPVLPFMVIYPLMSYMTGSLISREIDRIRLEAHLREDNDRKRKALMVATDGYFEWDLKTDRLITDSNYYMQAGYYPGEFEGTQEEWRKRVHPADLPMVEKNVRDYVDGLIDSYDVAYRFLRKDRSWMWIHARAVPLEKDRNGRILRLLGTHSDITGHKEAQMELRRLQSAIEHAAEAIVVTDTNGFIKYINPAFTAMTGYSREEVSGSKTSILKSGEHDNQFYEKIWSVFTGGKSWSGHIRNRRKNGTLYDEEIVISPVYGEDNSTIVSYVAIMRDITEDLDLRNQISQSRKMQALGQLAGGVAHDFNNMLTGILSATLMLRKRTGLDEKSLKYIGIIDEAVQRSAELTRSLLSFSRKQPHLLNIIDLHESVNSTAKLLRSTLDKSITLELDFQEDKCSIVGDAAQVENALLNLCINASHALTGGGKIRISTSLVHFDKARCDKDPFEPAPGEYIHLSVEDNGTGIAPEHLGKIFDPFFTTKGKNEGTGLGLTAVYTMIQQHKGSISVDSTLGRGTVFHLYFYRIDEDREIEKKPEPVDTHNATGGGHILLVDDEVLIRKPLHDVLTEAGYRVSTAEDGEKALEIFGTRGEGIDIVILDVVMPVMDGVACLRKIRDLKPEMPVIIQTGYSASEKISQMMDMGIQGVLRKPATPDELKKTISRVLSAQ